MCQKFDTCNIPDRIDVKMDITDGKTRRNLSIAAALFVGIPLFMVPTFIKNGYSISFLVLVMIAIYGVTIFHIIVAQYRHNIRGDINRNIERRDI